MSDQNTIERNERGQFVQGQSGNPNGRPQGALSLVRILRELLDEEMVFYTGKGKNRKKQKEKYAVLAVKRVMDKAIKDGNEKMLTLLFNYIDGKPTQPISGPNGGPIQYNEVDAETADAIMAMRERWFGEQSATDQKPDGNQPATKKAPTKKPAKKAAKKTVKKTVKLKKKK